MTAENENEAWVAPRPTSKLDQLPLVGLLRTYRREWIGGDLRGGISASLVMIPSVIAYAELANLRPEYGLYAALMAMLGYALFASSRQVIAGPDAALTLLAQVVAEPRVAPQFIITCDPAVRHLLTPLVEHLQALIMPALILHRLWHMALLTPLRVPRSVTPTAYMSQICLPF